MPLTFPEEYPELLQVVAHSVYRQIGEQLAAAGLSQDQLAEIGLSDEALCRVAFDTAEDLRQQIGGTMLYLPMGFEWINSKRNQEIIEALSTHPYDDASRYDKVGRQFDLSSRRVRQIEASWIAEQRRVRQATLFGA